ncbi:DinB family protein [Flavobacterium sp.]|jgi:hypothetical protein|uniref:DinB family protein n=1 Tax=Flavobacterium sp. TaxID=239 RepID=UPI002A80A4F6|nr:DinB family protein [Flavobacterium sp.]
MIEFNKNEFAPFYANYVEKANNSLSIIDGLIQQSIIVVEFFKSIPDSKLNYRYSEGKWTIKDILLHLIDAERIFAYRALRIARNDKTALSGFEENDYVIEALAGNRSMSSLLEEYKMVRNSTICLFKSFSIDQLKRIGEASNCSVSVRAIGVIIQGHEKHHLEIIKERYL